MRKPSKQQQALLGWLANPTAILLRGEAVRGHNWYYSGWSSMTNEQLGRYTHTYWEDWDGRTCRSFLARGWLDEVPNTHGWAEPVKLYKLNAAGRAAAERYLDLGEWVDEDEWERAKNGQEVT